MTVTCGSCQEEFELDDSNSMRFLYEADAMFNWMSTVCPTCSMVHHLFIDMPQNRKLNEDGVKFRFTKSSQEAVKTAFAAVIGTEPVLIDGVVTGFLDQLLGKPLQKT